MRSQSHREAKMEDFGAYYVENEMRHQMSYGD